MNKCNTTVKTDCFAYKNNNCTALTDLYCAKEKCNFYKTHQELLEKQLQLNKQN